MKYIKRLTVIIVFIVMFCSINTFAGLIINIGDYSLTSGETHKSNKATLQNDINSFWYTRYILPTSATKEKVSVYRYDGWWAVETYIAGATEEIDSQGQYYTRITPTSTINEGTSVGFEMKNTGNRSYDVTSGKMYEN